MRLFTDTAHLLRNDFPFHQLVQRFLLCNLVFFQRVHRVDDEADFQIREVLHVLCDVRINHVRTVSHDSW